MVFSTSLLLFRPAFALRTSSLGRLAAGGRAAGAGAGAGFGARRWSWAWRREGSASCSKAAILGTQLWGWDAKIVGLCYFQDFEGWGANLLKDV